MKNISRLKFIEYTDAESSGFSVVAVDNEGVFFGCIFSKCDKDGKKQYVAVNKRGKAILHPNENLPELKKQMEQYAERKFQRELKKVDWKKDFNPEEYIKDLETEHEYYEQHKEEIARDMCEAERQMEMKELRKNKAKNKSRSLGR